jgi:hypothetical protein
MGGCRSVQALFVIIFNAWRRSPFRYQRQNIRKFDIQVRCIRKEEKEQKRTVATNFHE